MTGLLRAFIRDDRGATAIEYGMIAAMICLAILSVLSQVGDKVVAMWDFVTASFIAAT